MDKRIQKRRDRLQQSFRDQLETVMSSPYTQHVNNPYLDRLVKILKEPFNGEKK